jgi:hypothetical protein
MISAIAFDQAPSNTGWAFTTDDEEEMIRFGTISMSDYGSDDQRMMRDLRKELVTLFGWFKPQFAFFEQIVINEKHIHLPTTYRQFAVASVIQFVAMDHQCHCELVEIARWRKRFLGRTNAPKLDRKRSGSRDWLKQAAVTECARRNIYVKNDHEAEAIGILEYGLSSKSPAYRYRTKYEAQRKSLLESRRDMVK